MPRFRFLLLAILAFLFLAGPSLVNYYTDWLWFGEVGYRQVFLTMISAQARLFTVVMVVSLAWLMLNILTALRSVGDMRPVFTTREGLQVTLPGRRQMRTIATNVVFVLSILLGVYGSSRWPVWVAWANAVSFKHADPILGHDVSFYVFSLPFLHLLHSLGQGLVVLAALVSGLIYLASGSLTTGFPGIVSLSAHAKRHLALLGAAFFVLLSFGAWMGRAERLLGTAGMISGASYADVYGRMPADLLLAVVALVGAGLCLMQAMTGRRWGAAVAVGLYLLVSVGGELYGTALQRFVVAPNEQSREAPFIAYNIEATRRAFALDSVETRELSGDILLTREDIAANAATLDNVRLWDHQPLLDTFSQIQEIRTYYDFVSVDNDRYPIDGKLRQVMLSVRELNPASLPNRTWVNERLTFTHGYGLTLGPVNQVTSEGLPVLYVRNIPPETIPGLELKEPSIYFGELSSDHVIVRTDTKEFHYPKGDENVFSQYAGKGGVPLNSLWRKLMFALRFRSYQILLSNDITDESRILFNRNIRDRVRHLAPFLTFDGDPYMVIADDRLVWLQDAYTISDRYPYSTPAVAGLNYIRNPIKISIDAYDGTTTMYLADATDPIAATYAAVFAGVFKPLAEMPATLRSHVRYPEDIFSIQASMYSTYHMTQAPIFYNREDQWEVPTTDDSREARPMQPYYTIMRLPGEPDAEFIQMLPFTPRRKDNLAAWLVARSDGEHYGHLRVFQFPKQKVIFGPRQVIARINQDQAISPQITLWNQQGSAVIWGTLMVIPIEESLIYVRPLYLRASGGRIPELTRVIVAHQNEIVMEETLDRALDRLFGEGRRSAPDERQAGMSAPQPNAPPAESAPAAPSASGSLAAQARQHYERAIEAQRAGDWARYGEEIKRLGEVLQKLSGR